MNLENAKRYFIDHQKSVFEHSYNTVMVYEHNIDRFITYLYNHDITNPPAFIQVELVRGLSKKLEQYHKITDGVAFSRLLQLK